MISELDKWAIKEFSVIGDFVIYIVFYDGNTQTIDFEPVIGKGWMKQLKDAAYFRQVILNEGGNLEWPDGQDFNPAALYNWPEFKQVYIDEMKSM